LSGPDFDSAADAFTASGQFIIDEEPPPATVRASAEICVVIFGVLEDLEVDCLTDCFVFGAGFAAAPCLEQQLEEWAEAHASPLTTREDLA
jgi:hypothetical protein